MRRTARGAALAAALAAAAVAVAQDAPAPPPPPAKGPLAAEEPEVTPAERSAIGDLVADLAAPEAHVRRQAEDDLVRYGAKAVPKLVEALTGASPPARTGAARALGRIGPAAVAAVPALRFAATEAGAPDVAAAAREALTAIEAGVPRLADLRARVASGDREARLAALALLPGVAAAERAGAIDVLRSLGADGDDVVRLAAAEAFARLVPLLVPGGMSEDVFAACRDVVAAALTHASPRVRDAGARGAVAMGDGVRLLARAALLDISGDDVRRVRPWLLAAAAECADAASLGRQIRGGLLAIAVIGADAEKTADVIVPNIDTLAGVRPAVPESFRSLEAATGAGVPARIRRRAALALGALGDDGTNGPVDALTALLADRSSRAQVEAAAALRSLVVSLSERPWRRTTQPGDVQAAIDAGIGWLVRHQDDDGGWDGDGFERHDPADDRSGGAGKEAFDEGVTALATLALVRSGANPRFSATSRRDAALRRGLVKLISIQAEDGCYGGRGIKHWIYTQAIGTLAMVEAYRRTGSPLWADSAQRGLDFLAACRNPEGSWRYDVRPRDADTSVNGWVVQALRAGERSGLRVDRAGYAQVLRYLDSATEAETGRVGYLPDGRESARTNEMLKRFPPALTTAMTSSACVQRLLLGREARTDAHLAHGLDTVRKMPPAWDPSGGRTDLYSWMAGTEAMSYIGGDAWAAWRTALRDALLPHQCPPRSGSRAGSWDPDDPWGPDGGRIYATAAAVLCLEIHQGQVPPLPRDVSAEGRGLKAVRALEAAAKDAENHETVRDAARQALAAVRGR